MKLEIYVGFDACEYSHEPKTKLYGLQLKKHENYVDFDVHACMNLKPSCMVCSSINLKIMLALMCMGTHMNLNTNLYGLQFKKLENYVGFHMYGYSHEFETKLYGLQIKRLVN
jgi:hypothetical protein